MPSISKLVRSVASVASSRSSDKSSSLSYTDTYFDEIGFKLGENSCLGSAESPDNLDGEEILFYRDERLFEDSDDDDDDEEEEEEVEDYGSHYSVSTTSTTRIEMTGELKRELDQAHRSVMSIPLSKESQQPPHNTKASRGIQLYSGSFQSYFSQLLRTDSLEYSPSASNRRPLHNATVTKTKNQERFPDLEISRTKSTLEESPTKEDWRYDFDGMDDVEKEKKLHDDQVQEEREFRTKATIKFLMFLGSFFLTVAIVVLILAITQNEKSDKTVNNDTTDTNGLIPLSQGWDIDDDVSSFLDASSSMPSFPPTLSPSTSPTAPVPLTDQQEEVLTILASVSQNTNDFIRGHPDSPQFQALEWLANDTKVETYSIGQVVQRWVLATFYLSTNGENWDTSTNAPNRIGWKVPGADDEHNTVSWMSQSHECEWYTTHNEKICDGQQQLISLSLGHRNLRGTLPTELGLLTLLKRLYLPDNHIVGSIPSELALFNKLESMQLSSNLITGSIPSELGHLSALGSLKLHNNRISGNIPLQLRHLESLSTLKINDNQMVGTIPVELFAMINLQSLSLESNQLSGQVPTALVSLPFLTSLTVYNNQITGTMPFETCNLSVMIADCDELICECCTECCIGCQGTVEKLIATIDTPAPTTGLSTSTPTATPSRDPSPAPTKEVTNAPTTPAPTQNPTESPIAATAAPSTFASTITYTKPPTSTPTLAPSTNAPSTSAPTNSATTQVPTVSPTSSPSNKPPVSAPSTAPVPTQIFLLITVGNDGIPENAFPLKMCQGDCDRNNQCEGDLVCYQRYDDRPVPGCQGIGTSGRDYCTHPSFIPESTPYPTSQPTATAPDLQSRCRVSVNKSCYKFGTDEILLSYEDCDIADNSWIGFFPVGLFFGDFFNSSPQDVTLTKNAADYWFPAAGSAGEVGLPSAAGLRSGDYIIYFVSDAEQSENVSGGQISINYSC